MRLPWSEEARLARLLRRSREGDREAFRELYLALYPRLFSFASRRCSQPADAEDVTSRAFHRLLERLDAWDGARGGVLPFALSIARNLIIDDLRSRRPAVAVEEDSLVDPRTPHTELLHREELGLARERLAALPKEVHELFALRYGDGLSHREIAELLGLSEAAVKQRFSRALRELKQEVSP